MEIVENEAVKFSKIFFEGKLINNLGNLKSLLSDKLYLFNKERDKLFFLNVLRKCIETEITKHKCNNTTCPFVDDRKIGLFLIDQEIDDISDNYQYSPPVEDVFTTIERVDLHNKLNEIIDKIDKQGFGQEILYDEIEDLKENFNLGKKNWFQLLKGKILDLIVSKVIDITLGQEILIYLGKNFNIIKELVGRS
jgi:hypothetical protein